MSPDAHYTKRMNSLIFDLNTSLHELDDLIEAKIGMSKAAGHDDADLAATVLEKLTALRESGERDWEQSVLEFEKKYIALRATRHHTISKG